MTERRAVGDEVAKRLELGKDSIFRIESLVMPVQKIARFWGLKLSEVDDGLRRKNRCSAERPTRPSERKGRA